MRKLDNIIIGWADALAAYGQKRGQSLAAWIFMGKELWCLALVASSIIDTVRLNNVGQYVISCFIGTLMALNYAVARHEFEKNKNYFDNVRLTLDLNAKALARRDSSFSFRCFWGFFASYILFLDVILPVKHASDLFTALSIIAFTATIYLETSFYLGPGQRRETQSVIASNTVTAKYQ